MKNTYLFFFLLLPLMGMISCKNHTENTEKENIKLEQELFDKVMAGHDEVMPNTGKLSQISRQLKEYLKENPGTEEGLVSKINTVMTKLQNAEEGMFDWMANFKQLKLLRASKSHTEIIEHLKKEDEIMKKVKIMTDESLTDGLELWKNLQPQ